MGENSWDCVFRVSGGQRTSDLPFLSKKIRTEEWFLTPIITTPSWGRFVTVLGFGKLRDSPILTQPGLTKRTAYYSRDKQYCESKKGSPVQIQRERIDTLTREHIWTEKFPVHVATPPTPLSLKTAVYPNTLKNIPRFPITFKGSR